MRPTTSRKTILIGLAAIAALLAFFLVSVKRGGVPSKKTVFTPPVYLNKESPTALIRPLYLMVPGGELTTLSVEQKQNIADFKRKILNRIASHVPLTNQEKTVLAISVATTTKPALGDLVPADQSLFKFSTEELKAIIRVLAQ